MERSIVPNRRLIDSYRLAESRRKNGTINVRRLNLTFDYDATIIPVAQLAKRRATRKRDISRLTERIFVAIAVVGRWKVCPRNLVSPRRIVLTEIYF